MFIDTHTHIYDPRFDQDRHEAIERALAAGVDHLILPGVDSTSHPMMISTVKQFPGVCFGAIGLHPTSVNDNPKWRDEVEIVASHLRNRTLEWVAVGEVGLDLHWSKESLADQIEAFVLQIELAIEYNLPLIIHSRKAWPEIFDVLNPYRGQIRGVFHSFSGDMQHLDAIMKLENFYLGLSGVVTYKTKNMPELLQSMPLSRILLETDSPYLPPVPYRGQRNESSYIPLIAAHIASIKDISIEELAKVTTANAQELFFALTE